MTDDDDSGKIARILCRPGDDVREDIAKYRENGFTSIEVRHKKPENIKDPRVEYTVSDGYCMIAVKGDDGMYKGVHGSSSELIDILMRKFEQEWEDAIPVPLDDL